MGKEGGQNTHRKTSKYIHQSHNWKRSLVGGGTFDRNIEPMLQITFRCTHSVSLIVLLCLPCGWRSRHSGCSVWPERAAAVGFYCSLFGYCCLKSCCVLCWLCYWFTVAHFIPQQQLSPPLMAAIQVLDEQCRPLSLCSVSLQPVTLFLGSVGKVLPAHCKHFWAWVCVVVRHPSAFNALAHRGCIALYRSVSDAL